MIGHAIERFFLHVVTAMFAFAGAFIGFDYWLRKGFAYGRYIVPAPLVALIAWAREPFDVAGGQPVFKVITDYASWALGVGLAARAIRYIQRLPRN